MQFRIRALVITRPGSAYLEDTLTALEASTRKPDAMSVLTGKLGAAVNEAVAADARDSGNEPRGTGESAAAESTSAESTTDTCDAYWILHDDSAPAPDALANLARTLENAANIGAVGCKQVDWADPGALLEVGIRATRSARRVPEVALDDRDGGQLDGRSDVLAVGSAGMLVRASALREVGGFDTWLGPFGDGLELSRRLRGAGWRVVVEPSATVRHARVSLGNDGRDSFAARRGAQLYNAVLAAPALLAPFLFLGYVLLGPVRALVRLLGKEARLADGEIRGAARLLGSLPALMRARRRRRRTEKSRAGLAALEARGRDVRAARREMTRSEREKIRLVARPNPLEEAERRRWHRSTARARRTVLLLTALVAGVAAFPLLRGGYLSGGALLPDALTGTEALRASLPGWLAVGDGSPGRIDALWTLLSPLALALQPFGGTLGDAAVLLLLCAPVLAGMTAFWAARTLTFSPHVRAVAGLVWAGAGPLVGALSAGHVAGALVHILVPVLAASVLSVWRLPRTRDRIESTAGLGTAALAGIYLAAAAPVMLAVLLLIALVGALRWRRLRWLWVAIPAAVVVIPGLEASWRLLFATPGEPFAARPSTLDLLSFFPLSQLEALPWLGEVALVCAACLVVIAVLALGRARNWQRIRAGWLIAAAGFAWAIASTRVSVAQVYDGATALSAPAWSGIGLSVALGGLWIALVSAGDGLRTDMSGRSFGLYQLFGLGSVAVLILSALAGSGLYLSRALTGTTELQQESGRPVPAAATLEASSPDRVRVLALYPAENGIRAEIWRGPGRQLTDSTMAGALAALEGTYSGDAAAAELASAVADMNAGNPRAADILAEHAISYVVIPAQAPRAGELARALGSTGRFDMISATEQQLSWRLTRSEASAVDAARLTLDGSALPAGRYGVDTELPASAGRSGGIVRLAERQDPLWEARLDGERLPAYNAGWAQAFEIPAGSSGRLTITYNRTGDALVAAARILAVAAALVVAIPVRRKVVE
ncbi:MULTISPECIES: glycosyltransferase family 2 protein [Actinotignum]|nr:MULTISPECIES: glycosyltransferase [Actinotignum]MDE1537023.1 glycosyltransferase [Actinotignum schaalii]MDK7271090.1 glycosyltransferase [Actinotignum schaalii]MDY5143944.1 glycosyltransferase [Actinotignum timonense]